MITVLVLFSRYVVGSLAVSVYVLLAKMACIFV